MAISTAILPGSIASGVGVKFNNVQSSISTFNFPQRIAVLAQPNTTATGFVFNERKQISSSSEAGTIFGFGSPIHLISRVLYNQFQNVGTIPVDVFPIEDVALATPSVGSLGFTGTQLTTENYILSISSYQIPFTLTAGTTDAEAAIQVKNLIDSNINLPVKSGAIIAEVFSLTSLWQGTTANDIRIDLEGTESGITIAIVAMVGGTLVPDVTTALANFGDVWETLVVNQFGDAANLTAINSRGEELWDPTIGTPFYSFYGSVGTDPAAVSTDTDSRLNERVNSKFPVPGSNSLEFEIAASVAAHVAVTSDSNAAKPYVGAVIYGILPGPFSAQWTYAERDQIEKRGCSTSYTDSGQIKIGDVLTTYHPLGLDNPGYRYVVDVVKSQFILGDISFVFRGPDWQGKILINDSDNSTNVDARKPSSALATMYGLIDDWADAALIVSREDAKANTLVERDIGNPNRLNIVTNLIYSGAGRIYSTDVNFSTDVGG